MKAISPASFALPSYRVPSAWTEHAPFAFWLVDALKPAAIVELGVFTGYSYFALCQAVAQSGIACRCHGIDTWAGDEHAGQIGDAEYQEVLTYNAAHYAGFSTLLRATFDEALPSFAPGSIDLLHIDGQHFYEDVKRDFDGWFGKLSPRSVVLLHDTAVMDRDFGVHRFFAELGERFPTFAFLHGHGLGIVATGAALPETVTALFAAAGDARFIAETRAAYVRLGGSLTDEMAEIHATLAEAHEAREQTTGELAAVRGQVAELAVSLSDTTRRLEKKRARLAAMRQNRRRS